MKTWISAWIFYLCMVSGSMELQAQWLPSEGIDGAETCDIVVLDSTLFIGTSSNGIFSRNISGGPWEQKLPGVGILNMIKCTSVLFAWNNFACYRSTDHGNSWQLVTSLWGTGEVVSLCAIDSTLFLTNSVGVFRSDDFGNTAYPIMNNLPAFEFPSVSAGEGSTLFCFQSEFSPHKLFKSQDKGITWDSISQAGLPSAPYGTGTMSRFGDNFWISTTAGVYMKNDVQGSWVLVMDSVFLRRMNVLDGVFCASSEEQGFFRLDPIQNEWISENNGLETMAVFGFCAKDSHLFLATGVGPYTCSTSYNWLPFYDGLHQTGVKTISFLGEEVWLVTSRGTFTSTSHGSTFTKHVLSGMPDPRQLILTDTVFYAIAANSFYVSHDHGDTWSKHDDGLPAPVQWPFLTFNSLVRQGEYLFLGTNLGLYRSPCQSIFWTKLTSIGLPDPVAINLFCNETTLMVVKTVYTNNDYFYTFRSTDHGLTFDSIGDLPPHYQPVFSDDGSDFYALSCNAFFGSMDCGASWTPLPIGNSDIYATCLSAKKPAVIVGGSKLGITLYDIYLSITYNDGATWTDIRGNLPVPSWPVMSLLAVNQQRTFASPTGNGLWYQDGLLTGTGEEPQTVKNRIKVVPNPAKGGTNLLIDLPKACTGTISVKGMMGNVLFQIPTRTFEKGRITERLELNDLVPGLYLVSLQTNKEIYTCKLQVPY